MRIGVLALQGAVSEHHHALAACGADPVAVRTPHHLAGLAGLVLPGGESTTLTRLLHGAGLWEPLTNGTLPLLGTCAGAILLGRDGFARMDIEVTRNAWGRQRDSFQAPVRLADDEVPFPGVFIRAPALRACRGDSRPVAWCGEHVVGAAQRGCLALTFHPELSDDRRLHRRWLAALAP